MDAAASFTTLGAFAATVVDLLREFDGVGSGVIEGILEAIGGTIVDASSRGYAAAERKDHGHPQATASTDAPA